VKSINKSVAAATKIETAQTSLQQRKIITTAADFCISNFLEARKSNIVETRTLQRIDSSKISFNDSNKSNATKLNHGF